MRNLWLSIALGAALSAGAGLAAAQQTAPDPGTKAPAPSALVNGALAVPGAPADTDTIPSKFSPRNAASDALPIAAFRLRHLTDDQRRDIARQLSGRADMAMGPAGAGEDYVVGSEVPAVVALQQIAPVPDALAAKFPGLRGTGFMAAGKKVVLVDLDNSLVIGVLDG